MRKNTKVRGRPATNPYIEAIIAKRARAEKLEPPEKRMITKVLAAAIQEDIEKAIRENEKLKRERVPKLSTIEKKILKYSRGASDEDKPWSLVSLKDFPTPPEALPAILKLWVWMLDEDGLIMTVREAKWAARFYAAVNVGAKNVEEPMRFLSLWARAYATTEMIAEMTNTPMDMGTSFDAVFWVLVTGQPITDELGKKIHRRPEPNVYWRITPQEAVSQQQVVEQLGNKVRFELYALCEKSSLKKKGGAK